MEYTLTFTFPSGWLGKFSFPRDEDSGDAVALAQALGSSEELTDVKLTRTSDEEMEF